MDVVAEKLLPWWLKRETPVAIFRLLFEFRLAFGAIPSLRV